MAKTNPAEYREKYDAIRTEAGVEILNDNHRQFIERAALEHRFTFQELRRIAEIAKDFELWGEAGLESWWGERSADSTLTGPALKRDLLSRLEKHVEDLTKHPTRYNTDPVKPTARESKPLVTKKTDKTIWGMCPVASEETVCCNLRTIDAVENCVFGCSYCSVQTFYTGDIVFDEEFAAKLRDIPIDPDRFYHFGTGQASDSLAWGNKHDMLDALCEWAAAHPNVLLELKTKSNNVRYFDDHDVPSNVVCSWSLNTSVVIDHEEHFTAGLDDRIAAARAVAGRGVGVAFHFHPMVHYEGWERDYTDVVKTLQSEFTADEVRFVSFGSVTLIKPVIKKIRRLGNPTKINQIAFVPDPHGKLTYEDDIKADMFTMMYEAFEPWRRDVFLYLCMEKSSIWERSFGYVYQSNNDFEIDFGQRTLRPGS